MAYYNDKNELIWVQRDGTEIPMAAMTLSHLTFTVEMLKRNAQPHLEQAGFDPEDIHRIFPCYPDMVTELYRRLEQQRIDEEHPAETRMRYIEPYDPN